MSGKTIASNTNPYYVILDNNMYINEHIRKKMEPSEKVLIFLTIPIAKYNLNEIKKPELVLYFHPAVGYS